MIMGSWFFRGCKWRACPLVAGSQTMGNKFRKTIDYLTSSDLTSSIQKTLGIKVYELEDKAATSRNGESNKTKALKSRNKKGMEENGSPRSREETTALPPPPWKRQERRQYGVPGMDTSPEGSRQVVVESYKWLDLYFMFATEFGYEPFYVTFLPNTQWNLDTMMFRHCVLLWGLSMYVGQASKHILKWPRPRAPPIVRMEINPSLEKEFGFPSTHATVSTTIPFYMLYLTYWRYEQFFYPMLFISIVWCTSVCLSRVYNGVHNVLDLVGGVIIAVIMLALLIPFLETLDYYILYWPYAKYIATAIVVLAMWIYPTDDEWTRDRGDTGAIIGATLGALISFNIHGPYPDDLLTGPFELALPTLNQLGLCVVRFVIGIMLVLPCRFIMKLLCFRLLPAIMPAHGVKEVNKRPLVELPYKLITYSAMCITATYLSPWVFELCGISRWDESII